MPELPEVEVVRRSLEPHLIGDRITRVEVHNPALREPIDPTHLRSLTTHREITALRRRAKYLLIDLSPAKERTRSTQRDQQPTQKDQNDAPTTLVLHLGMSGRLTLAPPDDPRAPHEHVAFHLASDRRLRLRDPRRFGLAFALPTPELPHDRHFAHLGPEPLSPDFDGATLERAAANRRGPVKPFLMNAEIVVGVGNIYASEALHRAGIHPTRSVARIATPRWHRLAQAVQDVLQSALAEGGTTLNDFTDGEGSAGYFQVSLRVYDREGEPCPACGAAIRRIVQTGRATYYCPRCQR